MTSRVVIDALRVLLIAALAMIVLTQVVILPWLSGVVARELPDEAFMRWPILGLAVLGLLCVEVAVISTLLLLRLTREDRVFTKQAFAWVDAIIGAFMAAALVCLATIAYQSMTVAGPFLWTVALWGGVLGGVGMGLLMWTMRALLVQATSLRADMEMVI
ncbi:MAG: DUF2975 domain-containing protein [Brachybacterium faecium]|nr:MAG: DUF2975 domain-containing protein [Brachybacterium faecium]